MIQNNAHCLGRAVICSILIFNGIAACLADESSLRAALSRLLNDKPASSLGITGRRMAPAEISAALAEQYRVRDWQPIWVSSKGPGAGAAIVRKTLKSAAEEGLRSEDYRVEMIEALWDLNSDTFLAKLEVLLSIELAAYLADVKGGRTDPRKLDPDLFASARDVQVNPVELALAAIDAKDLAKFIASQPPNHVHYRRLKKALVDYREIAAQGEWEPIADGETLKPGMRSDRILLIRDRLKRTGDLSPESVASPRYDQEFEQAVKQFQSRFHLNVDGAIGKNTIAAMNVPLDQLIRRIIINMERWRWLSHKLGDKGIFVNIASFSMQAGHDGIVDIEMPVIVGEQYHKTPVFSASIKYLEFNPYWNIPDSIATDEMYPALLKDPEHLKKQNIRMFEGWAKDAQEIDPSTIDWAEIGQRGIMKYRLRQDPGPKNSLGRIKFMFPNRFDVYLHDTPAHHLFSRARRDFSHGCIRVSRPFDLASYLLGGAEKGWDEERMKKILERKIPTRVRLKKPFPIHILYRTASVDADGLVYFAEDIYDRDRMLEQALY